MPTVTGSNTELEAARLLRRKRQEEEERIREEFKCGDRTYNAEGLDFVNAHQPPAFPSFNDIIRQEQELRHAPTAAQQPTGRNPGSFYCPRCNSENSIKAEFKEYSYGIANVLSDGRLIDLEREDGDITIENYFCIACSYVSNDLNIFLGLVPDTDGRDEP